MMPEFVLCMEYIGLLMFSNLRLLFLEESGESINNVLKKYLVDDVNIRG
jgi:hypothetical protein